MPRRPSPQQLIDTLAAEKAMQLRLSGTSYAEIAQVLDLAEGERGAVKLVERAMAKHTKPGDIDKVRLMQNMRIDMLLKAVMPKALRGELMAVDRVVSLENMRARLFGTYATVRSNVELSGQIIERHQYDNLTDDERMAALRTIIAAAEARSLHGRGTQTDLPAPADMDVFPGEVLERS